MIDAHIETGTKLPCIILSAERYNKSIDENDSATKGLEASLIAHGLAYKPLDGCYKGTREKAFLVVLEAPASGFKLVRDLAASLHQESILYLTADRRAALTYVDSANPKAFEWLGTLRAVEKVYAISQDAYTYDPESGQYWIVE